MTGWSFAGFATVLCALAGGVTASESRCGWNWHDANYVCRDGCDTDRQCDNGMKCWARLSSKACGKQETPSSSRCGWSWDDATWACRQSCDDGECGGDMKCYRDLQMGPCGPSQSVQNPSPSPRHNPSTGPETAGHSTRFWDCAKPSCAWPERSPDTVKACAQDGVTVLEAGAMSAMDGGPAYACFDQQPYVSSTDPDLSYGTAALTDDANCGKCFELTFADTAVQGKRMIVRIVNQGTDVGAVQADIAIPGGGVGLFDACTKQFGATPGARYGGVSSVEECSALHPALQPGCRWRFEWFEGADNPTFVSREVSCSLLGK